MPTSVETVSIDSDVSRSLNQHPSLIYSIIDATWYLPNSPFAAPAGIASAKEGHEKERIPRSLFVDLDDIGDKAFSAAAHNLPTVKTMRSLMQDLGVKSKRHPVVVYDAIGMFSSPRMLYTLEAFGHEECRVLDGGLPAWKAAGFATISGVADAGDAADAADAAGAAAATAGDSAAVDWPELRGGVQFSLEDMQDNLKSQGSQMVDVRPQARFTGEGAEPRPGLRSGHIPGARNLPFLTLLNKDGTMKAEKKLKEAFAAAQVAVPGADANSSASVISCGSGMTAAIARLGMLELGAKSDAIAIYEGSWVEWGAGGDEECPVATGL